MHSGIRRQGDVPGILCALAQPGQAQPRLAAAGLSAFGLPGVIGMPTATMLPDGMLAFAARRYRVAGGAPSPSRPLHG